jgi:hypothetical protein
VSGGKTAGFHLAVKRRPREWDQGEHLLYAQHWPNISSSRVLFSFVFVDHSPSCPQQLALRSPYAEARPKWNGGYKLIVRLGAHGEQKGKKLPAVVDCRNFRR